MNSQPFPTQFTPTQPLVDPKTGRPTTTSYSFLLQMLNRTGGGTGIMNTVGGGLTATGSSVINALQLSSDWNLITVTPAGSGVILPTSIAGSAAGSTASSGVAVGATCKVRNNGANALNIYPPTPSFQIDALGAGNPYSLAPNSAIEFECWTTTQIFSA